MKNHLPRRTQHNNTRWRENKSRRREGCDSLLRDTNKESLKEKLI